MSQAELIEARQRYNATHGAEERSFAKNWHDKKNEELRLQEKRAGKFAKRDAKETEAVKADARGKWKQQSQLVEMVQKFEDMEAEKEAMDKQKKRAELVALENERRMDRAKAKLDLRAEDLQNQINDPYLLREGRGSSPASKSDQLRLKN